MSNTCHDCKYFRKWKDLEILSGFNLSGIPRYRKTQTTYCCAYPETCLRDGDDIACVSFVKKKNKRKKNNEAIRIF